MTEAEPQIDLTRIAFPSDHLSILDIRRMFPFQLDGSRSQDVSPLSLDDILSSLIDVERKLAENAFDEAVGRTGRWASYRDSQREGLTDDYIKFGLAQGDQHAAQLIRDFEAQAAEQGKGLGGPVR